MTTHPDQAAWTAILDYLSRTMTRATFDTWLRGSEVVAHDDTTLTVAVRSAYQIDWLNDRARPMIDRAAAMTLPGVAIRFVMQPAPGRGAPTPRKTQDDDDDILEQPILEAVREERVQVGGPAGVLTWTDFYIKLKVAFRRRALAELKGTKLSVFLCLALHLDRDGVAHPGIEAIMRETGYSRPAVCSALDELETLGLVQKRGASSRSTADEYNVSGYAWFGQVPAPALWEEVVK